MIEISLKELNDCWPSLNAVAESLTAGKMKYRFAKVVKAVRAEIDDLGRSLAEIASKHGAKMIGDSRFEFDPKRQEAELITFNKEASMFMRSEFIHLDFDSKYFSFDDLTKAEDPKKPINAADLSQLLWLISDGESAEETPKAKAAAG